VTGSLAYRKNEDAILRGEVPWKYKRLLRHIPPGRVIELGSAEGVLACRLAQDRDFVTAVEGNVDRHAAAKRLFQAWVDQGLLTEKRMPRFVNADILSRMELLCGGDVLVAVRMIYYLRDRIDQVFAAAARHIPIVVLCGNRNRADAWRRGQPHAPLGEFNRYAALEGMREVLERHGYRIVTEVDDGDEIVVGRR
jgi:hypothetical protein